MPIAFLEAHAVNFIQNFQALFPALVATIEDEAMRLHDGRRSDVLGVAPEDRAGCRAAGAEDALGRIIKARALGRRLQALFCGRRFVVDEKGQHRAILCEERLEVHNQVFDDTEAKQWLDNDRAFEVLHEHLAGQHVASVDAHRVRPAHAVRARAAQRQRAVVVPLHFVQRIEHAVGACHFDVVFTPPRHLVLFRVITPYLHVDVHGSPLSRSPI